VVLWERGRVAWRARVVDAERGAPVRDAVVELDSLTAVTADDGVATLLRVPPGPHELRVRTPSLTLLRAAPAPRTGGGGDAPEAPLVGAVPSEPAALALACGARVADWGEAMLRGEVAAPNGSAPNGSAPNGSAPDDSVRAEATWRAAYVRLGAH